MNEENMKRGQTWLMRESGYMKRVRLVNVYKTSVEVEERSPLIGWSRPYIVHRGDVMFVERIDGSNQ